MDTATLIRRRAARLWQEEYARDNGGLLRGEPGAIQTLRDLLTDVAERVFQLSVIDDESLAGTNIEGELNREDGLILLRPGLPEHRANFVLAHEIGHYALRHPLHRLDTPEQVRETVTPDDLSVARQQQLTGLSLSETILTTLRGYNTRDIYEMQANAFATEFLVPGDELRRRLHTSPEITVADLAGLFGVEAHLVRQGMAQTLQAIPGSIAEGNISAASGETAAAADTDGAPGLDTQQQEAATCDAPALVIAGPGAGKTRILVARYARLVKEERVSPRSILALTFANKAAGEMRERLAALIGQEREAEIEVFTFHAFGLQLLQQYGDRLGLTLPLRLVTPMDALLLFRRRAAHQAYGILSDLPRAMENLKQQLEAIARSKEENAGPELWAALAREWQEAHPGEPLPEWAADGATLYAEYQKTLREHGLLDYGDLQTEAVRLFSLPEVAREIRERYQHILVDEFQDINYVSGRLVRELDGGRGVVWVVGDPRQAIYGFRGASPINLARFRTDDYYPRARVVSLTRNYRSVPSLVAAGMAVPVPIFGNDPALVPPPLIADRTEAAENMPFPAITNVCLSHGDFELAYLVRSIRREQEIGTPLAGQAVLVRVNRHAEEIAAALSCAGIPHNWGGPLEERPVFRLLMSALLLAADDARGIVGLVSLSPGAEISPDAPLSEADSRCLFAEKRGRWGARRLLNAAVKGEIDGLSDEGKDACAILLAAAEAMSATARPYYNLCLYLFEHAHWLRRLLPEAARADHRIRAILATLGQVLDLSSGFAAQRDALARSVQSNRRHRQIADKSDLASVGPETTNSESFEIEADTRAFLEYLQSALESGGLGVPSELEIGGETISILTAHRSKGLEWPVVYLPFCAEGEFPLKERNERLPLPPGLIHRDGESPSAAHDREESCLFYVAVTRSRDRLYLSSSQLYKKRKTSKPSELRQNMLEALRKQPGVIRLSEPIVDEATLPPLSAASTGSDAPAPFLPITLPDPLPSRCLEEYQACPRRYLYSHVYTLRTPGDAFLDYYQSVYKAAQVAGDDPARLRQAFEENWRSDGPGAENWQTPLLRQAADRLVDSLAGQISRHAAAAETAEGHASSVAYRQECLLNLPLPPSSPGAAVPSPCRISFRLDEKSTAPSGERHYARHRQSSKPPEKPKTDELKTRLYALYVEQEEAISPRAPVTIENHYPHTGQSQPVEISAKMRDNSRENLIQLVGRIQRGDTRPQPGPACARCAFSLICPR